VTQTPLGARTTSASSPAAVVDGKSAVARVLSLERVEYLPCFPANPLIEACAHVGIKPIVTRTERVAVNIADGFSRTARDDRIGVCAVQEGAGIENAFSGVAQAYGHSIPVLVLPSHAGRGRTALPPGFDAPANYAHITKWAAQMTEANAIPALLRRAFTLMRTGRSGPVLLELPNDVADEGFTEPAFAYDPPPRRRFGPDPADVRKAVSLLRTAERPVVLAGHGVHLAQAWPELEKFADRFGLPVMTTVAGKSAIRETHPLALGVAGVTATAMAASFLRRADLIFAIGTSLTKWWMAPPLPRNARIIQSTIDELDLNKDHHLEHAVLGDAKVVLAALCGEVHASVASDSPDVATEIALLKDEWIQEWSTKLKSGQTPVSPYRVIYELNRILDRDNSIVTHESGSPREQLTAFYESTAAGGYIGWGNSTQLGYSLGLALGAKLANPEKTVVNVMGDSAIGMVGMDLETAARYRIGIVTIVLNNSGMAGYESYMPYAVDKYGAKDLTGNYAELASALGVHGRRVSHAGEVGEALRQATAVAATGTPALVEVITAQETEMPVYWEA